MLQCLVYTFALASIAIYRCGTSPNIEGSSIHDLYCTIRTTSPTKRRRCAANESAIHLPMYIKI